MGPYHDPNWRTRRESIDALASGSPSDLTQALVEILSRDHQDLEAVSAALQMLHSLGSPAVTELVGLLKAPDADTRLYTALALGELGNPAALPALLEALDADPDPNVRFNVVEALGKLRAAEAVQSLTAILDQEDVALTFAAIHALGEIGDPTAQAALLPLLQQEFFAPEAVAALGKAGDLEAIGPILLWLESGAEETPAEGTTPVALTALMAIARRSLAQEATGTDDGRPSPDLPRAALARMVNHLGAKGRDRIIAILNAIEGEDGGALTARSGQLGDEELAACLPDLAELFGWLLAWETPNPIFSTDFLLDSLRRLLFAPNASQAAAEALAKDGPAAIQMLHNCLTDEDPAVRLTAARALAEVVKPGLLPEALVSAAMESALRSEDSELAYLAAKALGRSGSPEAAQLLEQALGHDSAQVREAALAALQALNQADLPERLAALLSSSDARVRQAALRGLAQHGPAVLNHYAAAILSALADSSAQVRQAAIESLPYIQDPQAEAALCEASQDPDPTLRMAAARALGEAEPAWAVPCLLRLLNDTHPWTRLYACRSLARHARPETIPDLAQRMQDPMPPVRMAAIEALERLGGPEALAAIRSASTDSEPEVRQAALQAIQRLEAAGGSA